MCNALFCSWTALKSALRDYTLSFFFTLEKEKGETGSDMLICSWHMELRRGYIWQSSSCCCKAAKATAAKKNGQESDHTVKQLLCIGHVNVILIPVASWVFNRWNKVEEIVTWITGTVKVQKGVKVNLSILI